MLIITIILSPPGMSNCFLILFDENITPVIVVATITFNPRFISVSLRIRGINRMTVRFSYICNIPVDIWTIECAACILVLIPLTNSTSIIISWIGG